MRAFIRLLVLGSLLVLGANSLAVADTEGNSKTVDDVLIYLGLLPAEMIRGHPAQHTESTMHGGQASGSGDYHVLIALFDANGGTRITDAAITARVAEIGLDGEEKTLEPMEIAGTMTFGNYFPMAGEGPFRIALFIRIPGKSREIKTTFEHWHR